MGESLMSFTEHKARLWRLAYLCHSKHVVAASSRRVFTKKGKRITH
jgi:hypothetical protein